MTETLNAKRTWSSRGSPGDSENSLSPVLKTTKMAESMDTKLNTLITQSNEIKATVDQNKVSLSTLMTNHTEMRSDIDSCQKDNTDLWEVIKCLEGRLQRQEKELERLREISIDSTFRAMRKNMVIYRLREVRGEDCLRVVEDFLINNMKIDPDKLKWDIVVDIAHRFGSGVNRPIVVRFTTRKGKNAAMDHCRNLKGSNYYVKDQLPKEMQDKTSALIPEMKSLKLQDRNSKVKVTRGNLYKDGALVDPCFSKNQIPVNATDMDKNIKLSDIEHGDVIISNGTEMQAHLYVDATDTADVSTVLTKLRSDPKVVSADHIIYAYRISTRDGTQEGYDDDREYGMSKKLLGVLDHHDIDGVLIVTKKDGNRRLKDKEKIIIQLAEDIVTDVS